METFQARPVADTPPAPHRAVWVGALFWVLFSVVMVAVRGVRWDENYEFAQVLLGRVDYPEGHPLRVYVEGFFSGQTRLLEAVMAIIPGALVPNALRNVAWLVLTTVPPFLLATLWTRRTWAAHLVVVLLLAGIHVPFYSNYPVHVWPGLYSNGPIGLGWALLTLYCLAARKPLAAGFTLGLLPVVHLGQALPALAVGLVFLAQHLPRYQADRGRQNVFGRFALGLLPGVVSFIALAALVSGANSPSTDPVYTAPFSPEQFFHAYMAHYASHRSVPDPSGFAPLIVALPLALTLTLHDAPRRHASLLATVYLAVVAVCVGVCWVAQRVLGPDVPYLLVSWMPYRLLNHAAPIGLAMAVAVCASRRDHLSLALVFALLAARPLFAIALPEALYTRYLADGAAAFFLLMGAASGDCPKARYEPRGLYPLALPLLAFAALLLIHQWGAACYAAGVLLGLLPSTVSSNRWLQRGALATGAVVLVLTVVYEAASRAHLATPPGLAAAREVLADAEAEIVLVPPQQEGFQARLGHAVMTDMATLTWIPYRPQLGATLYHMYRELYGIDLVPSDGAPRSPWFVAWPEWDWEHWQHLASRHHFSHVLVPSHIALDLPVAVYEMDYTLYRIKGAPA